MKLHEALFEIASQTTTVPEVEIARLKDKANQQTKDYTPEMGGIKGYYAKLHQGWIFQLVLMIGLPFIIAYLTKKKNDLLSGGLEPDDELDINHPNFM